MVFHSPSSFYRKDTSLPPEQRYYDGKPPEIIKFGIAWPANFELIEKTTEIAPSIHLIFQISFRQADNNGIKRNLAGN